MIVIWQKFQDTITLTLRGLFYVGLKMTLDDCHMAEIPGHHNAYFKRVVLCGVENDIG